jgi:hypothetical protein
MDRKEEDGEKRNLPEAAKIRRRRLKKSVDLRIKISMIGESEKKGD